MLIAKFRLIALMVLVSSTVSNGAPMDTRTEVISTGAGTDAIAHANEYRALLEKNGRRVLEMKGISQNGLGTTKAVRITHVGKKSLGCKNVEVATVGAPFLVDLYKRTQQIISLNVNPNRSVLDMEITGTIGTGAPSEIKVYFCKDGPEFSFL